MRTAIVGFGVLGKQLAALKAVAVKDIVVFDDGLPDALGVDSIVDQAYLDCEFFVTLGYYHLAKKRQLIESLLDCGRNVGTYIHPSVICDPSAKIGPGTIVFPGAIIGANVSIGVGCVLHTGTNLSHDITVGSSTYLAPGVVVSGNVEIGNECFIGTGTLLSNGIRIGDRCQIGIGSVVTHPLDPNSQGLGNPFRPKEFRLR